MPYATEASCELKSLCQEIMEVFYDTILHVFWNIFNIHFAKWLIFNLE